MAAAVTGYILGGRVAHFEEYKVRDRTAKFMAYVWRGCFVAIRIDAKECTYVVSWLW